MFSGFLVWLQSQCFSAADSFPGSDRSQSVTVQIGRHVSPAIVTHGNPKKKMETYKSAGAFDAVPRGGSSLVTGRARSQEAGRSRGGAGWEGARGRGGG